MKKLSIVIVNYNTEEFLHRLLQFIGKIPDDWGIYIVDNGSKKKFTLNNKNKNIFIIRNSENKGFAYANNQVLKKIKSTYALLLNPDMQVTLETIEKMCAFMDKHPSTGVATCKVLLASGGLDDACHRGFPTPWRAFCYFTGLSSLFPKSMIFNGYHLGYRDMDKVHEIDACVGAFMMIRTSVGRKIGWFDTDFFWYGEDLDFCYRIKSIGYSVYYVPYTSVIHYKGVSSGIKKISEKFTTADKKTRKLSQNARFAAMELFYKKHYASNYFSIINYAVYCAISLLKYINTRK